jgi:hypothetical protein
MSRDDPVMALRFFKTPCFLPRFFADDAEDFRSFVFFMLKHNKEVALSLFSKPHFAKRIKHNDYPDYDQLFDNLGKLGTMFKVSCKIMKCQALPYVMHPLMERMRFVNSASSFRQLIASFSGRRENVMARHA